ncbi:16S rRNA (uracil(1498)-N(3))-methyltransferase [Legionella hackeliae]|uniref:Ribosomal RNA small subunit methyltransferase E n=1 Tax=Legionella hackeliae TaxID=449 RepID=A0A0A8UYK3_LEGHA|nr:16S rRNA (uracil(1498)-N(3))-methyltransferase [Legionella hackeliae]KTD12768.1 16S rRNA methyltransferase [Legionella hackeliae]CEK12192.1 Ribosomal RNA small subunit methyltransferase E [Legionella hackeliae]STX48977.1 16S rRNA methyltransferase [Legionella hackeliae]
MREIRIYQSGDYSPGQELELSSAAGQHVGVVLRMQPGDKITLFCGDNREFEAVITSVHKKKVMVAIVAQHFVNRESPQVIHLAQGISKGERMEIVIQKAVELGVTSITPLLTERSVVRLDEERMEKKIAQWQAIAIAACEQCGRNQVPKIEKALHLNHYLKRGSNALKFVLHPEMAKNWRDYEFHTQELILMIGPEGGFSEQEISEILSYNFNPLSLGPRILRTETAAIAALSVLQAVCGDL